jgi:hypothetical protein
MSNNQIPMKISINSITSSSNSNSINEAMAVTRHRINHISNNSSSSSSSLREDPNSSGRGKITLIKELQMEVEEGDLVV